MPKLLQLNATSNWGSTGKIAEGIGNLAISNGWESKIAFGRAMNPGSSQLFKVGNKLDVYAHYARNRLFSMEGYGSSVPTKRLISKIKAFNPDIIHLHNIHDHWLNYPILFRYLNSIDLHVVWTFHDCWAFTGGCMHFESLNCMKWKTECNNCPAIRRFQFDNSKSNYNLKHELFSSLGNRLTIVSVSNWLASYIKNSFFHGNRIEVIHNGIDISLFKPVGSKANHKKFILGVSNVWPPYKGLNDFIQLRSILSPEIGIKLVGLSKKQIKSLPEGIVGIERTQDIHELISLYSNASVFVNPTYNDSFPTVNLEALACGTPVISYKTGGSPEAIDNNTGIVVEKGDLSGLALAINQVIHNPNKIYREACRSRAERNFDSQTQFNKYIELYKSLVS